MVVSRSKSSLTRLRAGVRGRGGLPVALGRGTVLGLALDARKDADFGVADEVDDDHRPGRVRGYRVVELRRKRAESGEARPRNRREVVVLVVVSNLADYSARSALGK